MYNKNKNRTEKNAVYKKIFRMEDHPQRDYAAAKAKAIKKAEDMERMKELQKYQEERNRERERKYGLKWNNANDLVDNDS